MLITDGLFISACSDETRFQGIATPPKGFGDHQQHTTCSDETRFQGIATPDLHHFPPSSRSSPTCSDETRFQGIATLGLTWLNVDLGLLLAVTRPVFRGLRREGPGGPNSLHQLILLAVTRPVFRGLRPSGPPVVRGVETNEPLQ